MAVDGRCRSKGEPNGIPIDEWGIRMEAGTCNPVGASSAVVVQPTVRRRSMRSANGMNGCATTPLPVRRAMTSTNPCRPGPRQRGPADFLVHRLYRRHGCAAVRRQQYGGRRRQLRCGGWPHRPHGPYWEEGQKVGYQDVGSWTILKSTPEERRKALGSMHSSWSPRRSM